MHSFALPKLVKAYKREVGPKPNGKTKDELIVAILNKQMTGRVF